MQISWHSGEVENRGAEEDYGREPGGGEDKNHGNTSHFYSSFLPRNAKAPVGGTPCAYVRSADQSQAPWEQRSGTWCPPGVLGLPSPPADVY